MKELLMDESIDVMEYFKDLQIFSLKYKEPMHAVIKKGLFMEKNFRYKEWGQVMGWGVCQDNFQKKATKGARRINK
tara:strand:- start:1605 stop:1832 length:228 start_codon:yes stop_codon:yes gene_type:complete